MGKKLTLHDIEDLDYLAEETFHAVRFSGITFGEDGQLADASEKEMKAFFSHPEENPLEFRKNNVLNPLTIFELCEFSLEEIKDRYLSQLIVKARNVMRSQAEMYGWELSEEISDTYLEKLFAIHWRWNAMLWMVQRGKPRKKERENATKS